MRKHISASKNIQHSPRTKVPRFTSRSTTDLDEFQQTLGNRGLEQRLRTSSSYMVNQHYPSDLDSEESSDDEKEDESYTEPEKRIGSKILDPNSKMKLDSKKSETNTYEYETIGGAKHEEIYDPKANSRKTATSNLQLSGPQYRNNAIRSDVDYKVHNHYGLSPGQSSSNQMVVSHNTPSWLGMRAGGDYRNGSLTSPGFNSNIEQKEKEWREDISSGKLIGPFTYTTETKMQSIDPEKDAEDIVGKMTNLKWDKERIIKRLKQVKANNTKAERIQSETRELVDSKGKKRKIKISEPDWLAFIPRRAYSEEAHEKYIEAREEDSEGSDAELEEKSPKKRKRK